MSQLTLRVLKRNDKKFKCKFRYTTSLKTEAEKQAHIATKRHENRVGNHLQWRGKTIDNIFQVTFRASGRFCLNYIDYKEMGAYFKLEHPAKWDRLDICNKIRL